MVKKKKKQVLKVKKAGKSLAPIFSMTGGMKTTRDASAIMEQMVRGKKR